jgi:uncharacterized membrane protein SpoIIM required for sporulation
MTEAAFVKTNLTRWQKFEKNLDQTRGKNPDELKELYLHLTDDLAYAETYYPGSEAAHYLHNLTGKVHKKVYKNTQNKASRFFTFFTEEVPQVAYTCRRQLGYSALIFILSMLIGAFSARHDENYTRLILGDAYQEMTEQNIANNDPMAVYKQTGPLDMFFAITFNNVRVSFLAFAAGIFTALGTGFILFQNGIMLGAFQYFFYQKGLFLTSFLTIWIHGTLEISAIIIAGAAGFIMGNSLVFPGTLPRLTSFTRGAKKALKLVIGLVPIFITAGFLESFVTRQTQMPTAAKITIIAASASSIIFYFIIYPKLLHKAWKTTPQ